MRRALLILAALGLLAVPAAALAGHGNAGDGTLAVRNASGDGVRQPVVSLALTGAVVGQLAHGKLAVLPTADAIAGGVTVTLADGVTPVLPNYETDTGIDIYIGNNLRFKAVGGFYRLVLYTSPVDGRIDLNAVGQGTAVLDGSTADPNADGWFSLSGGPRRSLPASRTPYQIGS